MKKSLFIALLLFSKLSFSQNFWENVWNRMAFSGEYRYLGRNVFGFGAEFRLNANENYLTPFNIGTKLLYTSINGKDKIIPQINMDFTHILHTGIAVSPYHIEPQIGISAFSFVEINTGYVIPISKERYFRGVTFGLQINIAPSRNTIYYPKMKIGY